MHIKQGNVTKAKIDNRGKEIMNNQLTTITVHFWNLGKNRPMIYRTMTNNYKWSMNRFKKLVKKYASQGATTIEVAVHKPLNQNNAYLWAMSKGKHKLTKQCLLWEKDKGITIEE